MTGRIHPRLRRWLRRAILTLAALVVLVVGLALVVVHALDRPFVKARVQGLARQHARVDLDYQAVHVRVLSGIDIDDLVVRPAPAFAAATPELAHVSHLAATWSGLFHVDHVVLTGVVLDIAVDDGGHTSLEGLGPLPDPHASSTPLSHQARELVDTGSGLPTVEVTGLSATLHRTHAAAPTERTALRGLELHLSRDPTAAQPTLRLGLGAAGDPLTVEVTRQRGADSLGQARTRSFVNAELTASELHATIDLVIETQSFVENLAAAPVLHAEARARFDEPTSTTTVDLENASAFGDVATLVGSLVVPDDGGPTLRHLEAAVDAPRLLAALPADLVPVRVAVGKGTIHVSADEVALDALPKLGGRAKVDASADLAGIVLSPSPAVPLPEDLAVATVVLTAHVEPTEAGALRGQTRLAVAGVAVGNQLTADDLVVTADLVQTPAGALGGNAGLLVKTVGTRSASSRSLAKDARASVVLADVLLDPKAPLATRGDVRVTVDAATVETSGGGARSALDGLTVTAHTLLTGRAPWAVDADVKAASVHVTDGGRTLVHAPLHADLKASEIVLDEADLAASPAALQALVDAGDVHVDLRATKGNVDLDYTLDTRAGSLGALRPFVADPSLPLERMPTTLRSKGQITGLRSASPSLVQHAEVRVEHPVIGNLAAAKALVLGLDSKGDVTRHELHGDLRAEGLAFGTTAAIDDGLTFGATLDRRVPTLDLHLESAGRAKAKVVARFGYDRPRQAITYDLDTSATELAPLAPLLASVRGLEAFDLTKLELALNGRGAILGVLNAIDADGTIHPAPAPTRTVHVRGTLGVRAKNVLFAMGNTRWSTPSVAVTAKLAGAGETRTVQSHVEVGELHLASGPTVVDIAGVEDNSTLTVTGDLADPELAIDQHLTARTVKQDLLPLYPVGETSVAVKARRTKDGVIHIADLEVGNVAGGTHAKLEGALDTTELQQRLSLRGVVRQDLARFSSQPGRLSARGMATIALRVESPDLATFRHVGDVRIENADVRVPGIGMVVEGADGLVPITVAVRVGPHGVRLLRDDIDNPYSTLRFTDQHPLLRRSSFLSVKRFSLPQVTIAPLVGNLQIEQNLVSLRQFEMGVRGGRVTGQCALDWNGMKSTLSMHVRADGVQSSHGEPFTGNAALFVSAAEHSIEGRADILKIGERHLLDILDLQDPFHADPAVNKVRSALKWGYPDRLRVTFDHGFASAHVAFGGLARFISVGDLRGIPMGPLIDQLLYPILPNQDEP